MRIYFVRHGESEANVQQVFSNHGYKHCLTAKGREQAARLAEALRESGAVGIYTSPLCRAVETAQIISQALGVPYTQEPALRECDAGDLEGRGDPQSWAHWGQVWQDWMVHGRYESRAPGGECYLDVRARFQPFLDRLISEQGKSGKIWILIGHGALFFSMLTELLVNVDRQRALQIRFPNTGYVLAEVRSEGLTCLEWCGEREAWKINRAMT